jgi:hypothetical protein
MDGMITTAPRRIDGPNHNELERMEYLADQMAKAVMVARHYGAERISFNRADAEELLQVMNDGLRTAKQLQQQTKPDWRVGLSVKPKYRNSALFYERGIVEAVHPSGWGGLQDDNGILQIRMETGRTIIARSEEWVTA